MNDISNELVNTISFNLLETYQGKNNLFPKVENSINIYNQMISLICSHYLDSSEIGSTTSSKWLLFPSFTTDTADNCFSPIQMLSCISSSGKIIEEMLPCLIFSALSNYTIKIGKKFSDDFSKNEERFKSIIFGNDFRSKISNFFLIPFKGKKPMLNESYKDKQKFIGKCNTLFMYCVCFIVILSLPLCSKANEKLCIEWFEKNVFSLDFLFSKYDNNKPSVCFARYFGLNIHNTIDVEEYVNSLQKKQRMIKEIFDKLNCNASVSEELFNENYLMALKKVLTKTKNSFALSHEIFVANCIKRVHSNEKQIELLQYTYNLYDISPCGTVLLTKKEKDYISVLSISDATFKIEYCVNYNLHYGELLICLKNDYLLKFTDMWEIMRLFSEKDTTFSISPDQIRLSNIKGYLKFDGIISNEISIKQIDAKENIHINNFKCHLKSISLDKDIYGRILFENQIIDAYFSHFYKKYVI